MSRLYFHSPSGDAELMGSEYHWLRSLIYKITLGVLDADDSYHIDRLRELIPHDHYMARQDVTRPGWVAPWASTFAMALRNAGGGPEVLAYAGRPIAAFSLALNTAALVGNDAIRLATRLAGQSDIHAYVEGPNRAWVADMMERGVDSGIYRKGLHVDNWPDGSHGPWRSQGWEDVIALLRARDDEPVVTSYSVDDSFPSPTVMGETPPMPDGWRPDDWSEQEWADEDEDSQAEWWETHHRDQWYDQPADVKWDQGMAAIRTSGMGLDVRPDDWGTFRFEHELTVLDLYANNWRERVERALGMERSEA